MKPQEDYTKLIFGEASRLSVLAERQAIVRCFKANSLASESLKARRPRFVPY